MIFWEAERPPRAQARMVTRAMELRYAGTSKTGTCGLTDGEHYTLTEVILAVVDHQMRDQNPPETRRTYERLVAQGYTPEDARRLISNVVAQEIFAVMQRGNV